MVYKEIIGNPRQEMNKGRQQRGGIQNTSYRFKPVQQCVGHVSACGLPCHSRRGASLFRHGCRGWTAPGYRLRQLPSCSATIHLHRHGNLVSYHVSSTGRQLCSGTLYHLACQFSGDQVRHLLHVHADHRSSRDHPLCSGKPLFLVFCHHHSLPVLQFFHHYMLDGRLFCLWRVCPSPSP